MIIRIVLNNSKYMNLIKEYFNNNELFNVKNYSSEEEYRQFQEDINSYNAWINKHQMKEKLEDTIKDNFTKYINSISESDLNLKAKKYILNNTYIQIKDVAFGKSCNGTSLIYFESAKDYVVL